MKKEAYIKFLYSCFCKFYQFLTTKLENYFFRFKMPEKELIKFGFFKYFRPNLNIENIMKYESKKVNQYLYVRILEPTQLNNLIYKIFDNEFKNYISYMTGFKFSIDYFIFYDRKFIKEKFRDVPTLKRPYSYTWHFDKPNSSNMLKIIIPLNITERHGPLKVIDKLKSKRNKLFKPIIENEETAVFSGDCKNIYAFNPTLCIHKDGIPDENLVASQIMFQLNPWHEWAINQSIYNRVPQFNKKIKVWNEEPKFPWFAYRSDSKIPI